MCNIHLLVVCTCSASYQWSESWLIDGFKSMRDSRMDFGCSERCCRDLLTKTGLSTLSSLSTLCTLSTVPSLLTLSTFSTLPLFLIKMYRWTLAEWKMLQRPVEQNWSFYSQLLLLTLWILTHYTYASTSRSTATSESSPKQSNQKQYEIPIVNPYSILICTNISELCEGTKWIQ